MACLQRYWIGLSFGNLLVRSAVGLKLTLATLSHHGLGLDGLGQSLYQSHPARVATSIEITDWSFSTSEHAIENAKAARAGSRLF